MSAGPPEWVAARFGGAAAATLARYVELLLAANRAMNLIGPGTVADVWTRHVLDCAQLWTHGAPGARWLDMGAGAGLPGLVLAILGADVHLVEATGKKARFLQETAAALGVAATVRHARVEELAPFPVDVVTARAVKPLAQLFGWGLPFAGASTRWVFPKGAQVEAELREARAKYRFEAELVPSETSPDGRVVVARGVRAR